MKNSFSHSFIQILKCLSCAIYNIVTNEMIYIAYSRVSEISLVSEKTAEIYRT